MSRVFVLVICPARAAACLWWFGSDDVDLAEWAAPDEDARADLVEAPAAIVFGAMVVTAKRTKIHSYRAPTHLIGDGVINIGLAGRSAAAGSATCAIACPDVPGERGVGEPPIRVTEHPAGSGGVGGVAAAAG